MALAPAELAAQLVQTAAFIDANAVILLPARTTRSRVPGGGLSAVPTTPPISWRCRLIPSPGVSQTGTASGLPGQQTTQVAFVLLALPDVDVRVGDTFLYQSATYRVETVDRNMEYELRAEVVGNA